MPPVLRSFTIFQDTPSIGESPAHKQAKPALPQKRVTRSLTSKAEIFVSLDTAPIAAPDKENLHPVTGERAGLAAAEKKRKDNAHILVTKLHNPPARPVPMKKHKKEQSIVLKDEGSPTKKRKASAPSDAAENRGTSHKVKTKVSIANKESSGTAKSRKSTSTKRVVTRARIVPSLPKVTEEDSTTLENNEAIELKVKSKDSVTQPVTKLTQSPLSQADIDSRCYELTVKPLADVSQAYEDGSPSQDVNPSEDKAKFQMVKEPSAEPEIRDYFAPPDANASNLQLGSSRRSPFGEPTGSTKTFSTPERKAIYAAFTFSSPSPSGERFSKSSRTGRVPRLELA